MKLFLFVPLLFFVFSGKAQGKDDNKTRQIEQLQQLKQTVTLKIDTLQAQLLDCAAGIDGTRKKLDQLTKETKNQDKPDKQSKEQIAKLTLELQTTSHKAEQLQKKFDTRLLELDKVLILQKDLEDKISTLARDNNR